MYEVGDVIRVVPSAHEDIDKSFLNYPKNWRESAGSGDSNVMLGGEYEVLEIFQQGKNVWYQVLSDNTNNNGLVSEKIVKKSKECRLCPFKIGDFVIPKPSKATSEVFFKESAIGRTYGLSDYEKSHKVTGVLNSYFIFIDYDFSSEYSYPFSWEDFQLLGMN